MILQHFCSIKCWQDFEIFIAVFIVIFVMVATAAVCKHTHTSEANIILGSEAQIYWLICWNESDLICNGLL